MTSKEKTNKESGTAIQKLQTVNCSNDLFYILGLSRSQDKIHMDLVLDEPAFPVIIGRNH